MPGILLGSGDIEKMPQRRFWGTLFLIVLVYLLLFILYYYYSFFYLLTGWLDNLVTVPKFWSVPTDTMRLMDLISSSPLDNYPGRCLYFSI